MAFYEDSEGDFNVLSEDEDLADASAYMEERKKEALKCSIVSKQFFNDVLRHEQLQSELNQSETWQRSEHRHLDINEDKAEEKKRSAISGISNAMLSKIDKLVKARVDAELNSARNSKEISNNFEACSHQDVEKFM